MVLALEHPVCPGEPPVQPWAFQGNQTPFALQREDPT